MHIAHQPVDLVEIRPVIEAPQAAQRVHQHDVLGVDEVLEAAIALIQRREIALPGQLVDLRLGAGQEPPPVGVDPIGLPVRRQHRHRIRHGRHRMAQQHHPLLREEDVLHLLHVGGEHGTDGRASGKEEVDHEPLSSHLLFGDGVAQLIDEDERQDAVVFVTQGRWIHQRRIEVGRLVNGQILLRGQQHGANADGDDSHGEIGDEGPAPSCVGLAHGWGTDQPGRRSKTDWPPIQVWSTRVSRRSSSETVSRLRSRTVKSARWPGVT